MEKLTRFLIIKNSSLFFLIVLFVFIQPANAQPQLGFTAIIQGLSKPVDIKNAGDASGRIFIVEQTGKIKIYKNGSVNQMPFLDLTDKVSRGEYKGLWSIVFSPNYKKDKTFFVYYVDKDNQTILARYKTSPGNPDSAKANSGVTLFALNGDTTGISHFGQMHFGKDGYLYVSVSDGSYLSETTNFAQNGQMLFGKILRLNTVNVNTPPYYSIPADNPFINDPNVRDEIWAIGFRNAWRWSFDRKKNDLWIADVGGEQWDEINYVKSNQPSGKNFGWPCYEGNVSFLQNGCGSINNYTFPFFVNGPDINSGAMSVIGGYVYRGNAYPALRGYYICSDYIISKAWKIISNGQGGWNIFSQEGIPVNIVGYGEDEAGELYAASLDGIVYSISGTVYAAHPGGVIKVATIPAIAGK